MYFIELIVKKLAKLMKPQDNEDEILPDNQSGFIDDYESCEHVFMPIDSTNETLACAKCGFIVKRADLKKKNFFES